MVVKKSPKTERTKPTEYTTDEMDAALGLIMLHFSDISKTYRPIKHFKQTMDDIRKITLHGQNKWQRRMDQIRKNAESELAGSRYKTYVYKGQMARNLLAYTDRSSQQRQRNNEASRRSRFLRSRRAFIQSRTNHQSWIYNDELDQELYSIRSMCTVFESRLRNIGYDMKEFDEYWIKLETGQKLFIEEFNSKSRRHLKRRRDSDE